MNNFYIQRARGNLSNKNENKPSKIFLLATLAFACGVLHRYHVSTLFENDRHFSHLSTLEREMTFRSEMGLYYSYYKTIVEATSFYEGIHQIIYNNLTEYPDNINSLERFNLLPEVVLGGLYKLFICVCDILNVQATQCWKINRGADLPPVLSCEGIRQPEYFYLEGVWLCASFTGVIIFLYGSLLSDSITGGIISILCFFYNHRECTRVEWTPPLRESFAYPFCLLHMYCLTWSLKKRKAKDKSQWPLNKHEIIMLACTTCLCLLLWQFSQFFLATQVLVLLLMFGVGFLNKISLSHILLGEFVGCLAAICLLFGNQMLISSFLFSLLLSSFLSLKVVYNLTIKRMGSLISANICIMSSVLLTVGLKQWIFITQDDNHIINLLRSKLTDYKDFHTLLYTCSVEFDFLGWEAVMNIVYTWLLPTVIVILLVFFIHWLRSPSKTMSIEPYIVYNIFQLMAFGCMALFIMRLKLFFTPQLCLLCSLITSHKYFKFLRPAEIHYSVLILILGGMSVAGVSNILEQHSILGEYSNIGLEELLTWVENTTPKTAVFAGSMPITAAVLLSTRRPIVNHPHYEYANLRERTKMVYTIYSRKPPEEIYKILSSLKIDYVIISENWCFSHRRKTGCQYIDLWDIEDPKNKDRLPTCPHLFFGHPLPFRRVFSNNEYVVLKLPPPVVEMKGFNSY